ncbi:hypothetical protein Wildcat_97 [Mycobacterium phage Wildcat]|uniref:Uncharacterized protein n=2 Tax=Mycobacterium virus Wildcat TaxID=1993859 RepID=Q19XW3_9CAUD|nr:hypothetical protein Wildcat_97 [Mycobacterium phage Wildcat]ABE67702.1 hypothetical protein Wildcat_97 [Mycobacterium phage Wildcat]QGJ89984.1 hypothetical protein PBI_MARYV_97 [Mycobacterium phage MaryV]
MAALSRMGKVWVIVVGSVDDYESWHIDGEHMYYSEAQARRHAPFHAFGASGVRRPWIHLLELDFTGGNIEWAWRDDILEGDK